MEQNSNNNNNKTHPSLPKNYVTLAQLRERWLKQQKKQSQQPENKEDHQKQSQQEEEHVAVLATTNVTVSKSPPAEQHGRKNRDDSVKVASEDRRKSETGVIIGGENADLDGKVGESKNKKKKNRWRGRNKPKVKERGAREEGNEVVLKTTIESKLNDEKKVTTVEEEAEQKIGGLSVNPRNAKQNGRFRRTNNNGFRQSQFQKKANNNNKLWKWKSKPEVEKRGASEEGTGTQGNEDAEKTTTEGELNDEKNANATIVKEVEEKIGGLSLSSGNDKQNGRFRRMNDGFRQSQYQRNYYRANNVRRVWVRKDGGIGEFEY